MALLSNYPVHLPLVHIAMNLADLCPDGRKKYEEFKKFGNAFLIHGRVQSMVMMYQVHHEFLEHLEECELCGGKDE